MPTRQVKPEIKERIINTVNTLVAEGIEEPTNALVLERLGKGSLSHVSPVMREWRDTKKAEVVAALEMPAELKKAIETSVGQVWSSASKLASATVENVRQEAHASIEAATGERDEALTEITHLEKHLADKEQDVSQVKTKLEQEHGQNTKLATENAALVARLDDRNEQITGLKIELKEARNDNKELQGKLLEIARKVKK